MPMATEEEYTSAPIQTTREPKGPKRSGDKGSLGDQAFKDALIILGICFFVMLFFMVSLRRHNI